MTMHNPPHPGEFITEVYLEPNSISGRELAAALDVSASTLSRVLNGTSGISPTMALRLSKALGRSPESWLAMQSNYDLSQAKLTVELTTVGKLNCLRYKQYGREAKYHFMVMLIKYGQIKKTNARLWDNDSTKREGGQEALQSSLSARVQNVTSNRSPTRGYAPLTRA